MSIYFNADEIFEMAEEIERNGAAFYYRAADGINEPGLRQLLLNLAEMEIKHEEAFAAMRAELSAEEQEPTVFDPEGLASLYIRDYASGQVFDVKIDPIELLEGKAAKEDILRMAIGLEKESIIFYLGMQEVVPKSLGKNKIDAIIKEEIRHITVLGKELGSSKNS